MSATANARLKIEALVAADTGAGGLREGANGAANVQGVYYEQTPDRAPRPYLVYSIDERSTTLTNYYMETLTIRFTIHVDQDQVSAGAGNTGDFGYTRLEAIRDRLITLLDGVTMAASGGWTFSPLNYEGRSTTPEQRLTTRTDEAFSCVATIARSVSTGTAGIVTGLGMSISGTLFLATASGGTTVGSGATGSGASFNIQAPYAFGIDQQDTMEDITYETDRFQRMTTHTKVCRVSVNFLSLVNGSTMPTMPVGELKALTLTMTSGATYTLATGGSALVHSMGADFGSDGQPSKGRYMIHVNGGLSPTFGTP